jgi:hypothetical protein
MRIVFAAAYIFTDKSYDRKLQPLKVCSIICSFTLQSPAEARSHYYKKF